MTNVLLVGSTAYMAALPADLQQFGLTTVGSFSLMADAIEAYPEKKPDLVIAELGRDEYAGIAGVARLVFTYPSAQVIGLTVGFNIMVVMQLEAAEARGHFARCWPPGALGRIIKRVSAGETAFATDYKEYAFEL